MTDQEINEAVARKLGGKPANHPEQPNYCHSIEAAWEIVEEFKWFCLARNCEGEWEVWDMPGTEEGDIISVAKTPAMAICLAFLKLKQEA